MSVSTVVERQTGRSGGVRRPARAAESGLIRAADCKEIANTHGGSAAVVKVRYPCSEIAIGSELTTGDRRSGSVASLGADGGQVRGGAGVE